MNSKLFAAALVAMALSLGANEVDNPVADITVSSGDSLTVRGALNPQTSVSVAGELTLTNAMQDAVLPADLQRDLVLWMCGARNFVDFRTFGSGSWLMLGNAENGVAELTVLSYFAILRSMPRLNQAIA